MSSLWWHLVSEKNIKIAYVDHKAALFACKQWHYSKRIPVNKLVKIGIWENDIYIGVIIFGVGASATIHKQFNLENTEVCELVRVALSKHKIEVSYLISRALKLLKELNPEVDNLKNALKHISIEEAETLNHLLDKMRD